MEEQSSQIKSLFERTSTYLETRLELVELKAIRKTSIIVSELASKLVLLFLLGFFLFIFNIGIALLLGELLGKSYYGFFLLAGFYGIIGLIFYYSRKKIIKQPVSNAIIKNLCD